MPTSLLRIHGTSAAALEGESGLVRAFYTMQVQHARLLQHIAVSNGLNPTDVRLIEFLAVSVGNVTPKDIVAYLELTTGAVTSLVDRLDTRGLVARLRNPDDRRSVFVGLTPAGRDLVWEISTDYRRALGAVTGDGHSDAMAQWCSEIARAIAERLTDRAEPEPTPPAP